VVDEEAAAVVQKIFALCIEGKGPAQIATWLRKNQILSPAAYWASKGIATPVKTPRKDKCKWSPETVSAILERLEYFGHTVNFKTYQKSFKDRVTLHNDPSQWAVFQNTHEAIIEESVFEIVQNLRKSRRRPTRMGDMGLFSGILFCEDCGEKMYLCRANHFKPEQEYYICSTYRKDRDQCTTHTIRNMILQEIVLRNLREAIAYVSKHESDFVREAAEMSAKEQDRELAGEREALAKAEKRFAELDTIIKRLYEDNVTGKLTDERFIKLSRDYENEQDGLKSSIETMKQDVKQREKKKHSVKSFIAAAKKYTDLKSLDGAVIREFIDRIEISAMNRKSKERRINIVYNFIGAFDFETAAGKAHDGQRKTA